MPDAALQERSKAAGEHIAQEEAFRRYVRRYVQTHPLTASSPLPVTCSYGVIDEFWFDHEADAVAYWTATHRSALVQELESALTRPQDALVFFARSHEVFGD